MKNKYLAALGAHFFITPATQSLSITWSIVSVISHCANRGLSENSTRDDYSIYDYVLNQLQQRRPFRFQTAQKNSASLCSPVWQFEN